jgi:hypothetical protein
MIKALAGTLLGALPCCVAYCERDGSVSTTELRADESRARIEVMRAGIGSSLS